MDIVGGLAAASKALEIIKQLRDVDKTFNAAAQKAKLAEAMEAASTAKITLLEAQGEIRERDEEIAKLKASFAVRENLVEVDGYKYRKDAETGAPRGKAFCSACEIDGHLVQVAASIRNFSTCPKCKANYSNLNDFR